MATQKRSLNCIYIILVTLGFSLVVSPKNAEATLKFYYDPDTGNVAFDTAETRDGILHLYALALSENNTPIEFIPENHIRLTNSDIYSASPQLVEETTLSNPLSGLYTIGEILPAGLSEETWLGLFNFNSITGEFRSQSDGPIVGLYGYLDVIGQGHAPQADFIYGAPEGDFENRLDLVDPDSITWAESAKLIYRKQTGEVLIDTTGPNSGSISAYLLNTEGAFFADNYSPILDVTLSQAGPDTIALFADLIDPGKYSLGNILQPGMDLSQLQATFNKAQFFADAGNNGPFQVESEAIAMQLIVQSVPEPGAMSLLLSAVVLSATLRRK